MLTLYVRSGCPFSAKALNAMDELGAPLDLKYIDADEAARAELMERGGMEQVPFLWGEDGEVNIYESDSIVAFLHRRFGEGAVPSNEA